MRQSEAIAVLMSAVMLILPLCAFLVAAPSNSAGEGFDDPTMAVNGPPGTVVIEANWEYNFTEYNGNKTLPRGPSWPSGIHPCQGAYVELWRQIPGGHQVVQTQFTDINGHVRFDPVEPDVYSVVIYADDKIAIRVSESTTVPNGYWNQEHYYPALIYNWTTGWKTVDANVVFDQTIEDPEHNNQAWMIYDNVRNARNWLLQELNWSRPQVIAYFPFDAPGFAGGAFYDGFIITYPGGPSTVIHEYAHTVMNKLYEYGHPISGLTPSNNDSSEINPANALSEGFAYFMDAAIFGVPSNDAALYERIENRTWANRWPEYGSGDDGDWDGMFIIGAVMNVLWDIYDGIGPSDYPSWDQNQYGDYVDNQLPYLWTVLATYRPNTMDEVWQHWEPKSTDLWVIFYHARMPSGERPTAPTSLVASIVDGNGSLRWNVPEINGTSEITGYNVYRGTDPTSLTLYTSVEGTVYVDTEIQTGKTYHYRVSAVNSAGEGVNSSIVSTHYAIKPSAPTNLISSGGNGFITLTWEAPTDDWGSNITSYSIYRGTSVESLTLLASTMDLTFTDLSVVDGIPYYYAVTALNEAGVSDRSDAASSSAGSVASAPSVPQTVTATLTNGSVFLSWKAPVADGGSPLAGYTIYRKTSDSPMALIAHTTDVQFVDAATIEGETYHYSVAAINSVGESAKSSAVNVTVPASSVTQTSTPFLETIEGQVAIAGLLIAGMGAIAYIYWRGKRP